MHAYKTQKIISKLLENREQRFALRKQFASDNFSSVSLNFNIPSYPKSSYLLNIAFKYAVEDLQNFLIANRIQMIGNTEKFLQGECGDFYIVAVKYTKLNITIKKILEEFETQHALGRLLDIDLFTAGGEMISSGKQKKCFLCNDIAWHCMNSKKHSYDDYKEYIARLSNGFLESKRMEYVTDNIAQFAVRATLYEVSLENKPGLVCPSSNGAHSDMDYFTFLSSSSSLSSYWKKITTFGYHLGKKDKIDYQRAKIKLRILGLEAEKSMFCATNEINTQKGIIFLLGLACFASGVMLANQSCFDKELFRSILMKTMQGVVYEDLSESVNTDDSTHGEQCFYKFGKELGGGARQEAEDGFPSVFSYGLNYLHSQIRTDYRLLKQNDWQEILLNLLLLIVSKSNDTNILYRKGIEELMTVQLKSRKILALNTWQDKEKSIEEFSQYCTKNNISLGGSADILALSLFVFFIENMNLKKIY